MSTFMFQTKSSNLRIPLPLFIPVYRPDFAFELFDDDTRKYGLNAVMVNSFLLYRDAKLRSRFEQGYTLRDHIGGFSGLLCTDSGAFQQLSGRKVELDALEIVKFQNTIQSDIAAPLDLLTPPETDYDETEARMLITQHRIEEAVSVCDYSDLAAIQQGGGFFSLRQKHIRQLAKIGFAYYGIGSMVPFFNKDHDLAFTCRVIQDAREVIGPGTAMHVYGAGDPLDIAFMYFAGANIFDSSSYAHYAKRGYYMTPYGAVKKRCACEQLGFECQCPICVRFNLSDIFSGKNSEQLLKRHNVFVILNTVRELGRLTDIETNTYLQRVYDKHVSNPGIFPNSRLASSWERYLSNESIDLAMEIHDRIRIVAHDQEERNADVITSEFSDLETTLLENMAEEIGATYKMTVEQIFALLQKEYSHPKNADFRSRVCNSSSLKEILRLRDYKTFKKNARGFLYQSLRQYKPTENGLEALTAEFVSANSDNVEAIVERILVEHVSTRERLPDKNEFIDTLNQTLPKAGSIIDIGCGFNPLMIAPEYYQKFSCYIAVDKDPQAVEIVRLFAKKFGIENLKAFLWEIGDGLRVLERLTAMNHYDFAVALKVVPVLYRADHMYKPADKAPAIPVLGEFPATQMLVTVCRESMTKHESIEKRELATLRQFIKEYDFHVESDVTFQNEFGFVLQKKERES